GQAGLAVVRLIGPISLTGLGCLLLVCHTQHLPSGLHGGVEYFGRPSLISSSFPSRLPPA
ncbi:MAG: hypothetical protein ACRD2L_15515, partial [Terriglobia bacterium]